MSNRIETASAVRKKAGKPARRPTNTLNDLTGSEWIKRTKSWFVCDSRRYHRNRPTELHPARFPEEMVADFITFFTKAGQWVLDPFCGSGAALVACVEEGRRAVGIELEPHYAEVARQRLAEPEAGSHAQVITGDACRLTEPELWQDCSACCGESTEPPAQAGTTGVSPVGRDCAAAPEDKLPEFDFIITSPPYWNMLRTSRGGVNSTHKQRAQAGLDTHYSENEHDLGNIKDYEEFIEALGSVFGQCRELLKPDKYMVVVVQNLRVPDGYVVPLAWDLARRISRSFSFQGERIWCQDSKQLGIWGYPKVFVPNYHHHYCLIFRNDK